MTSSVTTICLTNSRHPSLGLSVVYTRRFVCTRSSVDVDGPIPTGQSAGRRWPAKGTFYCNTSQVAQSGAYAGFRQNLPRVGPHFHFHFPAMLVQRPTVRVHYTFVYIQRHNANSRPRHAELEIASVSKRSCCINLQGLR